MCAATLGQTYASNVRGMISQGVVVLCRTAPSLGSVVRALHDFEPKDLSGHGGPAWLKSELTLRLPGPAGRGTVIADIFDLPWPDEMGDAAGEIELFGAWSTGFFGPMAFPGNLARAAEQPQYWTGAPGALAHRAFIRLLVTYAAGAAPDDPVIPPGVDPIGELQYLTHLQLRLLDLPEAICAFNPNGEVLMDGPTVAEELRWGADSGNQPLQLWSHVRQFAVDDGWLLLDTVGAEQWDRIDQEALVPPEGTAEFGLNDVVGMLRNLALYLNAGGRNIEHGDTTDGPGGRWQCLYADDSIAPRPRPTMRWLPLHTARAPESLVPKG